MFNLNSILRKQDPTRLTIEEREGKLVEKKPTVPKIPIEEFMRTRLVSNRAMRFPAEREGIEAITGKEILGLPVKIPFRQKEILLQKGGIQGMTGGFLEWPEQIVQTVKDFYDVATTGATKPEAVLQRKGPTFYKTKTGFDIANNVYIGLKSQGASEKYALGVGVLAGTSQVLLDLIVGADIASKSVLKIIGYDKVLDNALFRFGMDKGTFTIDGFARNTNTIGKNLVETGNKISWEQFVKDWMVIQNRLTTKGVGVPNNVIKAVQDTAKFVQDPFKKRIRYPLIRKPKEELPGMAFAEPEPAFAPGLTIRKMKPVGKGVPEKGIIPKELEPLAKFEQVKIRPSEIKDTKIVKSVFDSVKNIEKEIKGGRDLLKMGEKKMISFIRKKSPLAKYKTNNEIIKSTKETLEDNIRDLRRWKEFRPKLFQATKEVREAKPVIKPKDEFEAYFEKEFGKISKAEEEKILKAEFQKEANLIKKETEGQLFRDIRDLGGIKSYRGKFMAEELRPVPLSLKNNKTGMPLDEMAESLKTRGHKFESDSELLEAILSIRIEAKPIFGRAKAISTIKTLRTIAKTAPKKTAEVSRRLLNKLYRLKYPKIPAEVKSVRRAIEAGKISPEWEGKTISEMRKIKGFTEPKSVPTERLSIFDNFINLNKIARKNVPYKQMGIAEIIRGNKTFPAIRQQSGFYAKKEIQTAPIRDVYSQLLSPYHMALKQDGYKLGEKFGIMFKKVWKPTEKAIRGEKEFSSIYCRTIKNIGERHKIKATKENLEHLSDVIEKKVKATPNEELFIRDIRKVLDDLRNQANDIRQKMRKNEIGYITDYIPHIQKTTLWNELLSNVATISDNLDFIIPNAVKNPFAHKRMLAELPKAERNLYILLDRYIRAISKDIYITPAIENIKAYNSVLKNRELFNASKYWDEYIRYGLIGKQHKLDTALSIGLKGRKALQRWNNMVNLAFLTGKVAWNVATQPLSYIMNVPMEAGIRNSITAIYKSFNKSLRQYVKENSNVLAIKTGDVRAVAIGEGRNIQNRIYKTKIDKYNDFISMLGSVEERELTRASYIAGLERAKNLGYKGQDALDFADLTAARTQSMYNRENRALVLDSDIARTLFPFQSFSVEMFNHLKEISTKASGAVRLTVRQRTGKLFGLLVGLYLANLYSEELTGRKKTTVGTFFPFIGNYVDILMAKAGGKEYYSGRSPITVMQIGEDVIKGSRDFIQYGDIRKLRKVGINFGLALGGMGGGGQINNLIDGIMANINEDVRNIKGDVMFEVKDAESKIKAPIFGVWATKEGIEYWQPKEEEKTLPREGKLRETKLRKGKLRW